MVVPPIQDNIRRDAFVRQGVSSGPVNRRTIRVNSLAMKVFTAADLAEDHLKNATVAVLGYGNQGHAHAQNLRDSGTRVVVGARASGAAANAARRDGFHVMEITAAT